MNYDLRPWEVSETGALIAELIGKLSIKKDILTDLQVIEGVFGRQDALDFWFEHCIPRISTDDAVVKELCQKLTEKLDVSADWHRSFLDFVKGHIKDSGDQKVVVIARTELLREFLVCKLSEDPDVKEHVVVLIKGDSLPTGLDIVVGFGPTIAELEWVRGFKGARKLIVYMPLGIDRVEAEKVVHGHLAKGTLPAVYMPLGTEAGRAIDGDQGPSHTNSTEAGYSSSSYIGGFPPGGSSSGLSSPSGQPQKAKTTLSYSVVKSMIEEKGLCKPYRPAPADDEKVGFGTFGKIFRVPWGKDDSYVAAKYVLDSIHFAREARALSFDLCDCDFVPEVYWYMFPETPKGGVIVMKLYRCNMDTYRKEDLRALCEKNTNAGMCACLNLMCMLIDAVIQIHERNDIHRDLKPKNMLIDERKYTQGPYSKPPYSDLPHGYPRPILCDFGLTKHERSAGSSNEPGSPLYQAPELKNAKAHASASTDAYSIGRILFFMKTGENPDNNGSAHRVTGLTSEVNDSIDSLIARLTDRPDLRPNLNEVGRTLAKLRDTLIPDP